MSSTTSSSLVREGVLSPCPLQIKPKDAPALKLSVVPAGYDSDLSPLTTGPSSASSSVVSLVEIVDESLPELTFPEPDPAYKSYHRTTFLAPFSEKALYEEFNADEAMDKQEAAVDLVPADDPEVALQIAKGNKLTSELFAAVCPSNLNEMSVFLYGRLASPALLGELLANNPRYRSYEQAARMFPATLKDFALGDIGNTSISTIVPKAGSSVEGFVLFSTSIRERIILKNAKGDAFEQVDTQASIQVDGSKMTVPVSTSMCLEKWRKLVNAS